MARRPLSARTRRRNVAVTTMLISLILMYYCIWLLFAIAYRQKCLKIERRIKNKEIRRVRLWQLIGESDSGCVSELRMDRKTFHILCEMLRDVGGLKGTRNLSLEEIVAQFLYRLSHHLKNRTVGRHLIRSGETVSRHFNSCLLAVLKLHNFLLKPPEPVPKNSTDGRWKYFKNCLGALDGTHVKVTVPTRLKGRYRSRKVDIVTNVLGVCAPDMQFIYILPGWEGSAHDGRVLRDAISRPNGLRVPQGCYYLVDAGYTNANGFLAPYRGQRYHLGGWTAQHPPNSADEYFNMRHAKARNIIERCFGRLKGRWAILRSPSYFPIKTQCRIIMACKLLHNLILQKMSSDPMESEDSLGETSMEITEGEIGEPEFITGVTTSNEWSNFRDVLAQGMYNSYRASH
ncbi:hypothetical protein ACP4OV_012875 [Aristida adscensionis]